MKISYNQLTVKEYQDLQKYFKSEMSVDDWIKVLSYLSNKPVSHWESIPIKTLKKYLLKERESLHP